MTTVLFPPSMLPNSTGFRFIGILKDGRRLPCEVWHGDDGTFYGHHVRSEADEAVNYFSLYQWHTIKEPA